MQHIQMCKNVCKWSKFHSSGIDIDKGSDEGVASLKYFVARISQHKPVCAACSV